MDPARPAFIALAASVPLAAALVLVAGPAARRGSHRGCYNLAVVSAPLLVGAIAAAPAVAAILRTPRPLLTSAVAATAPAFATPVLAAALALAALTLLPDPTDRDHPGSTAHRHDRPPGSAPHLVLAVLSGLCLALAAILGRLPLADAQVIFLAVAAATWLAQTLAPPEEASHAAHPVRRSLTGPLAAAALLLAASLVLAADPRLRAPGLQPLPLPVLVVPTVCSLGVTLAAARLARTARTHRLTPAIACAALGPPLALALASAAMLARDLAQAVQDARSAGLAPWRVMIWELAAGPRLPGLDGLLPPAAALLGFACLAAVATLPRRPLRPAARAGLAAGALALALTLGLFLGL